MVPFRFSFAALVVLAGSVVLAAATATQARPMPAASPYAAGRPAYDSYSPLWNGPSPIIMTSINYPGLYGSFYAGVPALTYNTRPSAGNFYAAGATDLLPPRLVADGPPPVPAALPPAPGTEKAHINIMAPSEATVTVQGAPVAANGGFREFVSPPLPFNQDFVYTICASWTANGREVVQERVVRVHAGQQVDVDLNAYPRTEGGSTLRTQPLP
jgi:uncharacterized protein (TIGR03000 family)